MSVFADQIAARTLWGEARGESDEGKLAVAHVIRNRIAKGHWGASAASVCLANAQFSCWDLGDPNRRKMLDLGDEDPQLMACLKIWLVSSEIKDPTGGAQHYKVVGTYARWAEGIKAYVSIGHHEFFVGVA